ncbi:MAG TPA: EamA family transporter [Rubrivivax sp.]|nr:EamA family transporter [Rubrivivax sp.]
MRPRDVIELLVLSLLWGGAYLFTRAAVPAFGPLPLVSLRLGIAALVLLPILLWRGLWPQLAAHRPTRERRAARAPARPGAGRCRLGPGDGLSGRPRAARSGPRAQAPAVP